MKQRYDVAALTLLFACRCCDVFGTYLLILQILIFFMLQICILDVATKRSVKEIIGRTGASSSLKYMPTKFRLIMGAHIFYES